MCVWYVPGTNTRSPCRQARECIRYWGSVTNNTGYRLQRVRLQRAPGYNEQTFLLYGNSCHWHQCYESLVVASVVYNELNSVNVTARYKRDPVYIVNVHFNVTLFAHCKQYSISKLVKKVVVSLWDQCATTFERFIRCSSLIKDLIMTESIVDNCRRSIRTTWRNLLFGRLKV